MLPLGVRILKYSNDVFFFNMTYEMCEYLFGSNNPKDTLVLYRL
jgi:hypothetical protein